MAILWQKALRSVSSSGIFAGFAQQTRKFDVLFFALICVGSMKGNNFIGKESLTRLFPLSVPPFRPLASPRVKVEKNYGSMKVQKNNNN